MKTTTGEVSLVLRKKKNGKTIVAQQYFKLPLQIMTPHYYDSDGTAFIYLMNPGGGVLQHDRLLTEITAERGTSTVVTTPANTKFYKMDEGHAEVINRITVENDAVMEYIPEHNVPFENAKVYQNNFFRLGKDSVLFAADMVTEGRTSRGEHFKYDIYSSKTKIFVENELVLYDSTFIEPNNMTIQRIGIMEDYSSNGSLFIYAKDMDKELKTKIDKVSNEKVTVAATNVSDDLMAVRFLSGNIMDVKTALLEVWGICRNIILDKDSIRIRKY